jgi:hypothetical protein
MLYKCKIDIKMDKILGSHSDGYEDFYFLRYNTV